jgi:hypothetical protein
MNVQELDERVARKVKLNTSADSVSREGCGARHGFAVGVFPLQLLRIAGQRRNNKT